MFNGHDYIPRSQTEAILSDALKRVDRMELELERQSYALEPTMKEFIAFINYTEQVDPQIKHGYFVRKQLKANQ